MTRYFHDHVPQMHTVQRPGHGDYEAAYFAVQPMRAINYQPRNALETQGDAHKGQPEREACPEEQVQDQYTNADSVDQECPESPCKIRETALQRIGNTLKYTESGYDVLDGFKAALDSEVDQLICLQLPRNTVDQGQMDVLCRGKIIRQLSSLSSLPAFKNPYTLQLAVRYFDTYASKKSIANKDAWHIALACVLLASKMNEVQCLQPSQLALASLTTAKLIEWEADVWETLGFRLRRVVHWEFFDMLICLFDVSEATIWLGYYLLEISNMSPECSRCRPSSVAVAALLIAIRNVEGLAIFNRIRQLAQFTSLPISHAEYPRCYELLLSVYSAVPQNTERFTYIYNKYTADERCNVAMLPALSPGQ